jgi:nucleoside-diphosphate-sugar epimerase
MTRTIAVTGASGFVGRALCARFRADGWEVVGVDRVGIDVVRADLRSPGPWQDRIRGCDAVVHTAALVSQTASSDDAWAANVQATRHVVDAVGPGARLVHFSSAAVYSSDKPDAVDETYPVRPGGLTYGDTKIASELVVLAAVVADALDGVIVRPSDVYGVGSRPWTDVPVAAMRARLLTLPARGRGVVDPVFIDDLVDGVVAAVTVEAPAGRVYNLSGATPTTTAAFFGEYASRLGLAPPRVVATGVAMTLARGIGALGRVSGRNTEVGPGTVAMLAKTGWLSPARAQRELGWTARVSIEEGMARTVARLDRGPTCGDAPS